MCVMRRKHGKFTNEDALSVGNYIVTKIREMADLNVELPIDLDISITKRGKAVEVSLNTIRMSMSKKFERTEKEG